jgi:hypothetical protein
MTLTPTGITFLTILACITTLSYCKNNNKLVFKVLDGAKITALRKDHLAKRVEMSK